MPSAYTFVVAIAVIFLLSMAIICKLLSVIANLQRDLLFTQQSLKFSRVLNDSFKASLQHSIDKCKRLEVK